MNKEEIIIYMLTETMTPFIIFLMLGLISFGIIFKEDIKELDKQKGKGVSSFD